MVVIVPGAAGASAAEFHSEVAHTFVSAEMTAQILFRSPAGGIGCKFTGGTGTLTAQNTPEMTFTPKFKENCSFANKMGIAGEATVNLNGCDYVFTAEGKPMHIECPLGKAITFSAGGLCTITIGSQTAEKVTYSNSGEKTARDIFAKATLTKVTSTATGLFCSATGTTNTGEYETSLTLLGGKEGGGNAGIWYS
jgi:hypothetical protein